jgi:hypothetical protein
MSYRRLTGLLSESFARDFKNQNLTLVFGKSSDETNEPDFRSTQSARALNGVVAVNLSQENNTWFKSVARNISWERRVFDSWDNTKNMDGKDYYAVVSDNGVRRVYWCLDNNQGGVSTIPPTGTDISPIKTADDYTWQFLYSISGDLSRFYTNKWIPVPSVDEINNPNLPSNSQLNLTKLMMDYWNSRIGSIIRFNINDSAVKNVRWSSEPRIEFLETGDEECTFDVKWDFFSNSPISTEDGYRLRRIDVEHHGKGYSDSFENLYCYAEPSFPSDKTVDNIFGNTNYGDVVAPFVYPVISPAMDLLALLNADSAMIVYSIDSSRLAQITDVTDGFNEVRLVKNLKDSDGNNFATTTKADVATRMTTKITVNASNVVSKGKKIASAQANSLGKTNIGSVVSANSDNTVLEVVNADEKFVVGDKLFDKTTLVPSLASSRVAAGSLSWSGKHTSTTAKKVGASTDLTEITAVDDPGIKMGDDSQVLFVNKITNADSYTSGISSYQFRAVIGEDPDPTNDGRRSSSGY